MTNATSSLKFGPRLAALTGAYPSAEDVFLAAAEGPREKSILARLWISEGIPFAFSNCPGLYEDLRASLAERLEIHPKQISVAGSGRLGYSLAPKKWGEAYRPLTSDLDWFAVSDDLFERLCENFERWRADYASRTVEPGTAKQRTFWNANRDETPKQIGKGFVDSNRVPNWEQYGVFLATNRCLHSLRVKMQKSNDMHEPPKHWTLRCYRDWPAYERQMGINLDEVVKRVARSRR